MTGPVSLPFWALKIAASSAFSCWPLATPASRPPLDLLAASVEYFLATALQDWPESRALRAAAALASVLASTMRTSRFSGVANFDLFFS